MAGHSKFANIQHRKAAQDKKRAQAFTKIAREIQAAVKLGGADPNAAGEPLGKFEEERPRNVRQTRLGFIG